MNIICSILPVTETLRNQLCSVPRAHPQRIHGFVANLLTRHERSIKLEE